MGRHPSRTPSIDADGDSLISLATTTTSRDLDEHEGALDAAGADQAGSSLFAQPIGPICAYGPRLAYTYFNSPVPRAEALNAVQDDVHFFTVDDQLLYLSFFQDSGPLNAACLYRFCLHVHTLLENEEYANKRIFLYSSEEPDKKANAALLIALYAVRTHFLSHVVPQQCVFAPSHDNAITARVDRRVDREEKIDYPPPPSPGWTSIQPMRAVGVCSGLVMNKGPRWRNRMDVPPPGWISLIVVLEKEGFWG
ncbi:BQ5605_C008g05219 [Microbotryum silenes-dioicae]|uniref:BQ5605_C008g05219 protein n=1 Tax=Microbotryum silenes-dioicae TaxID=796604 RepID=A0A2X0PE43_9BASI|nr:BQ5605_C008g05219 [Microbotryum silenes-dioicae]